MFVMYHPRAVHAVRHIPLRIATIFPGNVSGRLVFKSTGPGCRIAPRSNRERCMGRFAIRLLTLALFAMAPIAVPLLTPAHAAGDENPSPPASGSKKDKKDKSSSIDDGKFTAGYRTAHATVYDRSDYASA